MAYMAYRTNEQQLTIKVFEGFARNQCDDCTTQPQPTRPTKLRQLGEEPGSPPLLSPDLGPRSKSDAQVMQDFSRSASAISFHSVPTPATSTHEVEQLVTTVVRKLKIVADKIDKPKQSCSQNSYLTLLRSPLSSWEGVASIFVTVFNIMRDLARHTTVAHDIAEVQRAVDCAFSIVSEWVSKNGGWATLLTVSFSNSSSRCESPVLPSNHTSADDPTSTQTQSEGAATPRVAKSVAGGRSRSDIGAPLVAMGAKGTHQKIPLGPVRSCVELSRPTPPGTPTARIRACSDPSVLPLSRCPFQYLCGLVKELCEITVASIRDEDPYPRHPSPSSLN